MGIPADALTCRDPMDPHEIVEFKIPVGNLLETGEAIDDANWTLEVLAEGTALGLSLIVDGSRDAALEDDDTSVQFWPAIAGAEQSNAAFDDPGTSLPLLLTFQTTSSPYRKRQRTLLLKVKQQ